MNHLDYDTDATTDNNIDSTVFLDRYIFSSKPASTSSKSVKSRHIITSSRQSDLHQTTISYLPSTVSSIDSPLKNDLFDGFSFTQEAVKKHKSEFSLVSKLSGKPSKSKVLKKLGSKITSRKSKEKYQLTISTVKQTAYGNNLATDMNGLSLIKRRVVDQLYNNVINPAVGAKILENAELAFPFIPKTTRSIERLRTSEELINQYKVDFNDLIPVKDTDKTAQKTIHCSFVYNRPKTRQINLWQLSQLPPITFTNTDIIDLHQGDNNYYNLTFFQKRCFSTIGIASVDEKTCDSDNILTSLETSRKERQVEQDDIIEDYSMNASVNDPFDEMDDSVIITMENNNNNNNTIIDNERTQNASCDNIITIDSSPTKISPLKPSQKSLIQPELSQDSQPYSIFPGTYKSPESSALIIGSPSNCFNIQSIPEIHSPANFSKSTLPTYHTTPVETVEIIEIPESPIAVDDDFDTHFNIIQHAASKFGLQNTSSEVKTTFNIPIAAHSNSKSSQKQNFSKFTTPQLRDQMDKWGFKPVRTRKAMIKLLESCNVLVEPVNKELEQADFDKEMPSNLTVQVVDKMSTGDMKKTLTKLGIKHNGSRSQMTSILLSWSQSRNGTHSKIAIETHQDHVSEVIDSVSNNLSDKIMKAIKMDHEKHDSNSIWTRMLCYEPISLDELLAYLEERLDIKLDDKFVRSWCDAHGVTTTTVNSFDC